MKPTVISENTRFTFGAIAILIGGAVWLTQLSFQVSANTKTQEDTAPQVSKIATDVAVMKSEIHEIHKQLDRMEKQ